MKKTVIMLGIMAVVIGGISYSIYQGDTISAENPVVVATTSEPVVQKSKDTLEEARQELERVNQILDAEVADIEMKKAKLQAEIDHLDARMEEIRKIRTSF